MQQNTLVDENIIAQQEKFLVWPQDNNVVNEKLIMKGDLGTTKIVTTELEADIKVISDTILHTILIKTKFN